MELLHMEQARARQHVVRAESSLRNAKRWLTMIAALPSASLFAAGLEQGSAASPRPSGDCAGASVVVGRGERLDSVGRSSVLGI